MKIKAIVFLVSGNGGTLKFINEYIKLNKVTGFFISHVIGDRECGAIKYARRSGISFSLIRYSKEDRTSLYEILEILNPDFIITNIFKILDQNIVKQFNKRLINFHYSLLPAFKGFIGLNAIDEAIKLNCHFVGCTCHYVDELVDNGEIISQCITMVPQNLQTSIFYNVIFRSNCLMALNVLLGLTFENNTKGHNISIKILNNIVLFSPELVMGLKIPDDSFWKMIAEL